MMEQMGVDMEELDVEEVRMETTDGDTLVFDSNTTVNRINAQGQEMYQVVGEPATETANNSAGATKEEDDDTELFSEEDVSLVMEEANVTEEEAREALTDADGDIADAIMQLS